ncbi:MAG: sigma 54-interacting transcriptional regulator [Sporolactobacillus sp.]
MSKIEKIFQQICHLTKGENSGLTASVLADHLHLDRSTASRYLNQLTEEKKLTKSKGKPVHYFVSSAEIPEPADEQINIISNIPEPSDMHFIGAEGSMKPVIERSLAALLYPEQGLHILLFGETGVGKSYLAEYLAKVAFAQKWKETSGKFVTFNCADYAENPELLMGHIFGIKKGAFTGADKDEDGLVKQADNGILFLDEIHRLPPSGQEMLFYLIDKGTYRKLGESSATHHARLVLIGATTETLEQTLLPTLLRRFSLQLEIPPLRERTDEEREAFLSYFLTQEAKKMGTTLLIKDRCREAFLKYACPGNIGQLKNDIQISCARAFMHHLQQGTDRVIIQEDALPPQVLSSLTSIGRNNDSKFLIAPPDQSERLPIQNIYSALGSIKAKTRQSASEQRTSDQEMKSAINHYIHELQSLSDRRLESEPGWVRFIDHDLFDALRDSEFYFKNDFPFEYGTKQLIAIGLHLEAFRQQAEKRMLSPLPKVPPAEHLYRVAADKLVRFLSRRIQLNLPESEIELIAHLMASTTGESEHEKGISVYLITHGESTASSMAEVTNYLLGSSIIHPVDMPLSEATGVTYKKIRAQLMNHLNHAGILMLVDIGSLVSVGETLSKDLGITIRTLANVNLPMLIEAGRKALIAENDLDTVYNAAKSAYLALAPKSQLPERNEQRQRLIVTVCLTGEGAAQLLNDWLSEHIDTEDKDIVIRAIRIDPISRDSSMLDIFDNKYRIIAIVGTVPVKFNDVPFIPALELLMNDGIVRLQKLLEISRPAEPFPKNDRSKDRTYMHKLAKKGLDEITQYLDTDLFSELMTVYFDPISKFYQMDIDSEIGIWMHIGSLADKMLEAEKMNRLFSLPQETIERLPITREDREVWNPLIQQLENRLSLEMNSEVVETLISLAKQQNPECE